MTFVLWGGFVLVVLALIALDLGVFDRRPHAQSSIEAIGWTTLWISLALSFNVGIFYVYDTHWLGLGARLGRELTGSEAALQFFTGYLVEKSLSLDNIFVIAMIFAYFRIPAEMQHRLLFWGVLVALALRGLMIAGAVAMIQHIDWIVYVFGALLLFTALKVLAVRHDNLEPERNPLLLLTRRWVAPASDFDGAHLFVRGAGRRTGTPLFAALVMVVSTDVLFAAGSIPAILAVTREPFLVFTSNVFAMLGLRSLYFLLASLMRYFRYLKLSLVLLLVFVATKMILSNHYVVPNGVTLAVISTFLVVGLVASAVAGPRDTSPLVSPLSQELTELLHLSYRRARRLVVLVIGSTMLLIGALLLVLPGPGIPLMLLALTVLASEFLWARSLLRRAREQTDPWLRRVRERWERLRNAARRMLG